MHSEPICCVIIVVVVWVVAEGSVKELQDQSSGGEGQVGEAEIRLELPFTEGGKMAEK